MWGVAAKVLEAARAEASSKKLEKETKKAEKKAAKAAKANGVIKDGVIKDTSNSVKAKAKAKAKAKNIDPAHAAAEVTAEKPEIQGASSAGPNVIPGWEGVVSRQHFCTHAYFTGSCCNSVQQCMLRSGTCRELGFLCPTLSGAIARALRLPFPTPRAPLEYCGRKCNCTSTRLPRQPDSPSTPKGDPLSQ